MRHAAGLLAGARRLVVFTGAGVSAESGIPTFRDALDGLWARYDPAALATPAAFADDPALVWGWYEWRRQKVLRAQPNPAHRAIAALADRVADTRLVTQNVDDLHERAGSREVLHLHGSLHAPRCAGCAMAYRGPLAEAAEPEAGRRIEPPRCRACGGPVRPGWSGSARRCPRRPCARPSPPPANATCCSASAPPAWCNRRRGYRRWRWSAVPAWCM
ncbi:sir2 family protein [Pseudomonas paraeruginosa]|nr:sir2 family protein [Pseudomonas paraeruginosa]